MTGRVPIQPISRQPVRHPGSAVAAIAGSERRAQQQAATAGYPCTGLTQQCLLWARVQVLQHIQQQHMPGLRRQRRLHVQSKRTAGRPVAARWARAILPASTSTPR